jgi:hypothetical protein
MNDRAAERLLKGYFRTRLAQEEWRARSSAPNPPADGSPAGGGSRARGPEARGGYRLDLAVAACALVLVGAAALFCRQAPESLGMPGLSGLASLSREGLAIEGLMDALRPGIDGAGKN